MKNNKPKRPLLTAGLVVSIFAIILSWTELELPAQTRVLLDQLADGGVGAPASGRGPSVEDGYGLFDRGEIGRAHV